MKIESLIGRIAEIDRIVRGWSTNEVPAIERGIVLDKLKVLYEEIGFRADNTTLRTNVGVEPSVASEAPILTPSSPKPWTVSGSEAEPSAAQPAFEPVITPAAEPQKSAPSVVASDADNTSTASVCEAEPSVAEAEQPSVDHATEPSVTPAPQSDASYCAPAPEAAPSEAEAVNDKEAKGEDQSAWTSPLSEPSVEKDEETTTKVTLADDMPAEESLVQETSTGETPHNAPQTAHPTAPAKSEPQLFSEDDPMFRPRVDKQVILSLYGDDTPTLAHTPAPQQIRPVTPEESTGPVRTVVDTMESAHKKVVLGETLGGASGMAMNEKLGKQHAHADVASKLQSRSISGDLRQQIGINDRFMLVRSLFGGDSAAYEAAIDRFNSFSDLDEAMLYMQENFTWNPDSEGVGLLVELLERKLS